MAAISVVSPPLSRPQWIAALLCVLCVILPFGLWFAVAPNVVDSTCASKSFSAAAFDALKAKNSAAKATDVTAADVTAAQTAAAPADVTPCVRWDSTRWYFVLCGILAALLLYFLTILAWGQKHLLGIVIGADGKLSSSQLQLVIWTFVLLFSYTYLFLSRFAVQFGIWHFFGPFPTPPTNVLIAVGLGLVTAVGAAQIATTSPAAQQNAATPPQEIQVSLSDLVSTNNNLPDFTKLQMLAWTVVAASIYIGLVLMSAFVFSVWNPNVPASDTKSPVFPDIPQVLMWLMGLSQATYLGNKYVQSNAPNPAAAGAGGGAPGGPGP